MARFLLAVTVLLVLVAAASALKCYVCGFDTEENCKKSTLEGNPSKYLQTCSPGLDSCGRAWIKTKSTTTVKNSCTNRFDCEVHSKTLCAAYDDIDDVDCKFSCCDEDGCNAGSPISFSGFLLTVSSVLGLALMI